MNLQSILSSVLDDVYLKNEYPALAALEAEWTHTRPFDGLRVLVATPIYRNTMTEYRALVAGGANLLVGYSEFNDPDVVDFMREWGVSVRDSGRNARSGSPRRVYGPDFGLCGDFCFPPPQNWLCGTHPFGGSVL